MKKFKLKAARSVFRWLRRKQTPTRMEVRFCLNQTPSASVGKFIRMAMEFYEQGSSIWGIATHMGISPEKARKYLTLGVERSWDLALDQQ